MVPGIPTPLTLKENAPSMLGCSQLRKFQKLNKEDTGKSQKEQMIHGIQSEDGVEGEGRDRQAVRAMLAIRKESGMVRSGY